MPITRCPGCHESLEVPDVVPGGLVACPYCGKEFPARGGGARPPARGERGGSRRRPAYDDYEDERMPRGRFKKRKDPIPIVVAVVAVLVMGIVAVVVLINSKKKEKVRENIFLAQVASTPNVSFAYPKPGPAPERDPLTMENRYRQGDMITIMDLSYASSLKFPAGMENPAWSSLNYTFKSAKHGENVTGMEGDYAVHEGTYDISSFVYPGTRTALHGTSFSARFLTDRLGRLKSGSFSQTAGPTMNPAPTLLGNRSMDIMPDRPMRHYEEWGGDRLANPLASYVLIDGRSLESMGISGRREGGWRWEGGNLESTTDGTWTHRAIIDFKLRAVENATSRITFRGQPAELSMAVRWGGEAQFHVKQQLLVRVERMKMELVVRLKTPTEVFDWGGFTEVNFGMYKDP